MKHSFKKVLAFLFAFVFIAQIVAAGTVPVQAADPEGVVRGGTARTWTGTDAEGTNQWIENENSFLKDAPFGTVVLETAMMTLEGSAYDPSRVTFEAYDTNFVMGTRLNANDTETRAIVYSPMIAANTTATSADGFALTFKDAATLQDGQKRDVKVTYFNIQMTVDYDTTAGTHSFPVTTGSWLTVSPYNREKNPDGTDKVNPETGAYYNHVGAMQLDIKIEVLDAPEDATTLFSTLDLDVRGNGSFCPAEEANTPNNPWHESFMIVEGALSDAYIPTTNYLTITKAGTGSQGNGLKFAAAHNFNVTQAKGEVPASITEKRYYADESTYNSGFAVLTDASSFTLRWWGSGNGMGTQLYSSNIKHWIKTKSSAGGNITTVVDDEKFPKDGKETAMDVPDHKDATYVLEPEEGYVPGKLFLDGEEIDVTGITETTTIEAANGGKVEITPNPDGTYTVVFKDNTANHNLQVIWAKSVCFTKTWTDQGKAHSINDVKALFHLLANGEEVKDKEPAVEVDPTDASKFIVTYEDLVVCDDEFNDIEYTITEDVPEGYDPVDDITFTLTDSTDNPMNVGAINNTKTPQRAHVQFVDVDGEGTVKTENGEESGSLLESSEELTGPDNTPIEYATEEIIKSYTDKGYEVVIDPMEENPNYDEDPDKDQLFTVKLKHIVETITPDDPKTPEDPMNPDGTPYPEGLSKEDLTKAITRTIRYRYLTENGEEAFADVVQTVTFTRTATVDHVTGEVTYTDWTADPDSFKEVTSPTLEGYTPDKTAIPPLEGITPDSEDIVETVIYKPVPTYWVTYIDPETGETYLEKTHQPVGDPEPAAPAEPKRPGYKFDGWDREVDPDGNVTYKAKWVKEYWVTYIDPATGTTIMEKTYQPVGDPEPKAPADPTRKGFTFTGWEKEVDADGNVTYKATWKEEKNPKTGDFSALPAAALLAVSFVGLTAALIIKKRKEA